MAKQDYSVADLEGMLEQRRTELQSLENKRAELSSELAKVEREIADLLGSTSSAPRKKKTKKVAVRKKKASGARRPKNSKSLKDVIIEVLNDSKKGLNITQIMEKVQEAGYKTKSSSFKNVVYQNLYHMKKAGKVAQDDTTGIYKARQTAAAKN